MGQPDAGLPRGVGSRWKTDDVLQRQRLWSRRIRLCHPRSLNLQSSGIGAIDEAVSNRIKHKELSRSPDALRQREGAAESPTSVLAKHSDPWLIGSPSIRTSTVGIMYSAKFDKLLRKEQPYFLHAGDGLRFYFACG